MALEALPLKRRWPIRVPAVASGPYKVNTRQATVVCARAAPYPEQRGAEESIAGERGGPRRTAFRSTP